VEERDGGPIDDPAFDERLRAWLVAEAGQRLAWLAERDGQAIGMLNIRPPTPPAALSVPPAAAPT
jgi:hypothetical protein